MVHHLPFRQVYRAGSLRISGNYYFEAVLLYFTVPLSRILEPMCYCQNHSVLPLVIIPLIALFAVMGLESFYLLFLFPPELGGWSVLRLMRSFIKKEGMVYFEIIHSICITNFIPKIVIYGRY